MKTTPTSLSSSLVNERTATEFLGLAAGTLAVWRARRSPNAPPYIRVGRAIRYDPAALQAYINARTISSSGTAE